ncbi:unnamed protein product [Sphenostylis stenocarpa]|uniref:Uncharacterized protein n=1 Tax=Sphenostylis stenocarpa TaxID=92480 RepID=A0AA86VPY2_9FABA|nr:unnamed protein product [Sphenostylis stenocarpa]
MAAMNSNSNVSIGPNEEEIQTSPSRSTHLEQNDEVIPAIPISFYPPNNYFIHSDDDTVEPTKKEKEDMSPVNVPEDSTDDTMTETLPATQSSSSKRGRRPKSPAAWIVNWDVECKLRPDGNRTDKIYRHKEKGFRCRSLLECERYEKHGIRPVHGRAKAREKMDRSNISENETTEMVMARERMEAQSEEAIVAQRREEAENMKEFVEQFLAEAHYNQLHMFDP